MNKPLEQHQLEIARNKAAWESKPLLREIYSRFYNLIATEIHEIIPGRIVEIGSGLGNLKSRFPRALCTDLFPNPWLDVVCDCYRMPFGTGCLSHLILFDVFHHLQTPAAFLKEARRVLYPEGRLIIFEPYISPLSAPAYGFFHHEPVAWNDPIDLSEQPPRSRAYYAAQGNATRLLFRRQSPDLLRGWQIRSERVVASLSYLFSGGFSKTSLYPLSWLPALHCADRCLSLVPRLFGSRGLIVLEPETR